MQWLAVSTNAAGLRGVSMSVAEQTNDELPLMKLIRMTDFLRSAICASSVGSFELHEVDSVHESAALAMGELSKWTTAPTRTASTEGATGLKSSTSCVPPSVHGAQASVPWRGSTSAVSTRSPA